MFLFRKAEVRRVFSTFCRQYYWYYWLLSQKSEKWVLSFFHKGYKKRIRLIPRNYALFGAREEGEMGSGRYSDHWMWVYIEVYTWARPLAPTGSEWRAGAIQLGELQLRLCHLRVDGWWIVPQKSINWMKGSVQLWTLTWVPSVILVVPGYPIWCSPRRCCRAHQTHLTQAKVRGLPHP